MAAFIYIWIDYLAGKKIFYSNKYNINIEYLLCTSYFVL